MAPAEGLRPKSRYAALRGLPSTILDCNAAHGEVLTGPDETLLDLSALDPWFERMFGRAGACGEWFALMLRWSMVVTLCDRFRDFSALALESLDALADEHGVSIRAADRDDLVQRIRTLPAHADVEPALRRLQSAGLRLVALTNSAQATVDHQLGTRTPDRQARKTTRPGADGY